MKKLLLSMGAIALCVSLFGQAYTYLPYTGTPYSFPDGITAADMDAASTETGPKTSVGLNAKDFDKVEATSTYASDFGNTCGLNANSGTDATATVQMRGWDLDFATNPELAPFSWNGGPDIFRKGGGWYMYTVSFTEADNYDMFLRVRGTPPSVDNHIYTITVYDKANMSNVVKEWSVNLQGMDMEGFGSSTSADGKAFLFCDGRDASTGQAGSVWVKLINDVFSAEVKDYVIKVSHSGTNSNTGFGSFTFLKMTATDIAKNELEGTNIYVSGGKLRVSLTDQVSGTIVIYDLSGQVVSEDNIEGTTYTTDVDGLNGINIVKITTDKGVKVQKVLIAN